MRVEALYRALRPYLSHLRTCGLHRCTCGRLHDHPVHYVATVDAHRFIAQPCDCGLDALVGRWEPRSGRRAACRT